ncbi:MAG TPA: hypothetical protein DCP92_22625 [Nitrospiraceae bacterium]|nr:hypothetical protein [Nitrospiraceae bacterium]
MSFSTREGSRTQVRQSLRRTCNRTGINDLRFHDLRHAFAVLINNIRSFYQRQHAFDQKDKRMAAGYAHLLPENRDLVKYFDGV